MKTIFLESSNEKVYYSISSPSGRPLGEIKTTNIRRLIHDREKQEIIKQLQQEGFLPYGGRYQITTADSDTSWDIVDHKFETVISLDEYGK